MSNYTWIESPAWQLQFFGLPNRVPWPADSQTPDASTGQFDVEALVRGVEACVNGEPGLIGPWRGFFEASAHFKDMTEALEDQEYARASELLTLIDKAHPGSPYGLFHQAYVHRQSGDDQEAVRLYTEAAQKAPGVPFIWNNLGAMLAENGNRDQAIEAFMSTLKINQNDAVALDALVAMRAAVKLQRDQKDPNSFIYVPVEQFREMANAQVEHFADKPEHLLGFGEAMLREGIVPEAGVKAMEKLNALKPDQPRVLAALGAGYRMMGDFEKSKAAFTKCTELLPNDAWAYFNLAQTCNAAGDKEGERAALTATLERDPNIQPALGIFFDLNNDHGPEKEKQLVEFAEQRNAWMPYLLASSVARKRDDIPAAVAYAAKAYERNPVSEEVLLQYSAMLGDAGDGATLELVIQPAVTGGRFSKRLEWNFAQALKQVGKTAPAIEALRRAQLGEAPDDFKAAAAATIEFWSGLRAQSDVQLEVHRSGQLLRPVLLSLDDGEGGVLLRPREVLPAQAKFPWKARENGGTEARVRLQQGQQGLGSSPRPLGVFLVKGITPGADGTAAIDCRIEASPDGRLTFTAGQDGRMLQVEWSGLV